VRPFFFPLFLTQRRLGPGRIKFGMERRDWLKKALPPFFLAPSFPPLFHGAVWPQNRWINGRCILAGQKIDEVERPFLLGPSLSLSPFPPPSPTGFATVPSPARNAGRRIQEYHRRWSPSSPPWSAPRFLLLPFSFFGILYPTPFVLEDADGCTLILRSVTVNQTNCFSFSFFLTLESLQPTGTTTGGNQPGLTAMIQLANGGCLAFPFPFL